MGLRPAGLRTSCVVVDCFGLPRDGIELVKGTLELVPLLLKSSMSMKLFISDLAIENRDLLNLDWSEDTLKRVLDSVLQTAAKDPIVAFQFRDLFQFPSPEAEKMLVDAANKSFSRLLDLGNLVIQKHVERDSGKPYLDMEDITDVIKEQGDVQ